MRVSKSSNSQSIDSDSSYESLLGVWVSLFFVMVYGAGATLGIQGSDSSEFVLASISDNRVHPPGYPVLVLWLKCFQWLSDNPVWNAAFATAVLSSLSMGFIVSAVRQWTQSTSLSLWIVGVFGLQPLWLRYSTVPEAFAILGLVYSMLIWVSVIPVRWTGAIVMSMALGIGIGSHHLFVLAFPIILWNGWKFRNYWFIQVVGICVGMLSYGFLCLQSGGWGHVSNIDELLRFFLRMDYGTFQITHSEQQGNWWETPWQYLVDWGRDSWGIFPIAVFASLVSIRWIGLEGLIGISWTLSSVLVLSLFGLPTSHAYLVHSNRFFMAPSVLALPLIAIGMRSVCDRWYRYSRFFYIAWVIPLILFSQNFVVMGRFDTRMQDWLAYSCRVLPQDALVFIAGDGAVFGMQLGQQVLDECIHLDVVYPKLLVYDWYRLEIAAKGHVGKSMSQMIQQQASDRPIFSVLGLSHESGLPPSYPYAGVWMRYVPNQEMLPSPENLMIELSTFQQHYPSGRWMHSFFHERSAERWPSEQWAHSWWAVSDALQSVGQDEMAETARGYGMIWLPQ